MIYIYGKGNMSLEKQIGNAILNIPKNIFTGKVHEIIGNTIFVKNISSISSIGTQCIVVNRNNAEYKGEVIGFRNDCAIVMLFDMINNIGPNCEVKIFSLSANIVYPSLAWKGRIINCFGEAVDNKGFLELGNKPYNLKSEPISPYNRVRLGSKIDLGVSVLNIFTSCCIGQRMGIFAGSGVGKSVLTAMIARNAKIPIKIIGLIGERGREVKEFIEDYLGEEGLENAVIIVATSNESANSLIRATYLTLTVAEFFRDAGYEVLCIIDSITRFAMALREVGLSVGETASSRGYTPSVFSELPKLLERAGPGLETSISALFAVLVEGDDHNEPLSDIVRGILDGHIILSRKIAEMGRFPAVNILKSVSRSLPKCNNETENDILQKSRAILSKYEENEEIISVGIYKEGQNAQIDHAIRLYPGIMKYLNQNISDIRSMEGDYRSIQDILQKE